MQWFVDSPLLTLFFCIGVGSIFGRIPFGPVSFGPAGALFVALALSAIEPDVALAPIITNLSLCVFCYMVGIAAGPSFVNALRSGWQPVVVSILAILAMAIVALSIGTWFDLDIGTVAGAFSGAGTATAALGAVQQQLSVGGAIPPEPAIGYAVAYPITVFLTILALLVSDVGRQPQAHRRGPREGFAVRRADARTRRRPGPDDSWTVRALRSGRFAPDPRRVDRRRARSGAAARRATAHRSPPARTSSTNSSRELGRPAAREPWMDRSRHRLPPDHLVQQCIRRSRTARSADGGAVRRGRQPGSARRHRHHRDARPGAAERRPAEGDRAAGTARRDHQGPRRLGTDRRRHQPRGPRSRA